jgi:hypothetical protein
VTANWKGGDGDWNDANKWSTGNVPTASEDIRILVNNRGVIQVGLSSLNFLSLEIQGGEMRFSTSATKLTGTSLKISNSSMTGNSSSLTLQVDALHVRDSCLVNE